MKRIQFSIGYYNSHPGCKVVTRDGHEVRILCTDRNSEKYPVVYLVDRELCTCDYSGICSDGRVNHIMNLFIEIEPEYIYKLGVTHHEDGVLNFFRQHTNLEDAKTELELERVAHSAICKIDIYRFDMEDGTFERVDI